MILPKRQSIFRTWTGRWLAPAFGAMLLTALLISAPAESGSGDRTLTLSNQCSGSVWWGYTGGAVSNISFASGVNTCSSDADCPGHSLCSGDAKAAGQCYWTIGRRSTVVPTEIASGDSATVSLSDPAIPQSNGIDIKWSGNVWAAQSCTSVEATGGGTQLVCASTNCDPVNGCTAFAAPSGVHALAEFTLQSNDKDYYDISVISGYTMPVSMGPTGGQSYGPAPADTYGKSPKVSPSSYWCTRAGSVAAQGILWNCSWEADLSRVSATVPTGTTAADITLVAPVGITEAGFQSVACTADSDCVREATGKTCGIWAELNPDSYGPTGKVLQVCGAPAGMITPNGYCALAPGSDGGPWNCSADSGLTSSGTKGTYQNLYACNGINSESGYQATITGPAANVCGCENWNFGSELPVGQGGCVNSSATWQKLARWGAELAKRACTTAYSYPYDDETSTFNCETPTSDSEPNAVNYTIVFCPVGAAGGVAQ